MGQALSGFLISAFGFIGVMLFHSGLYIIASLLLMLVVNIAFSGDFTEEHSVGLQESKSILGEMKVGVQILKKNRPVLKIFLLATLINVTTIAGALLVVLVSSHYGANAIQFGFFNAAGAVTGILIGVVAEKLTNFTKPHLVFSSMLGIGALSFIGMASTSSFYIGTFFFITMTASSIIFSILQNSLMMILIEDRYRGRLLTLQAAISSMLIPVFSIVGGIVADLFHVSYLFIFAGLWIGLCALFPLVDADLKQIEAMPTET